VLFILGGITGVFLGAVVLDYEFRGTYWVVAHFHYVMVAGVTALIGGLYYWWPKISGKMYSERLGKLSFAVYFVGFNLLYFPMFLAWETPRRVFHPEGTELYHQLATVGAFVIGTGVLLVFITLAKSFVSGPDAPDNPWAYSRTAEWATTSPPPLENWPNRPSYANGRLEFVDDATAADGGAVAHERTGAAESLEADHEDHASIWPFGIGVGMFVMFLGLSGLTPYVADFATARGAELAGSTAGSENVLYPVLSLVGVGILGVALFQYGREEFNAPEMAIAERWPFEGVGTTKTGVWFFLASDVVVFGAVIGAYVFMRIHGGWGNFDPVPPGDDRTDQHLRPAHLEFHGRSRAGDGRTREQARAAVVDGGHAATRTHVPRHQGLRVEPGVRPRHLLVHRPRVLDVLRDDRPPRAARHPRPAHRGVSDLPDRERRCLPR